MTMKATVQAVTEATVHRGGADAHVLPHPASVEIEEGDGGFYLFRLDSSGECISDTWHESLKRAKLRRQTTVGFRQVCEIMELMRRRLS